MRQITGTKAEHGKWHREPQSFTAYVAAIGELSGGSMRCRNSTS